jgi:hypothetical protein
VSPIPSKILTEIAYFSKKYCCDTHQFILTILICDTDFAADVEMQFYYQRFWMGCDPLKIYQVAKLLIVFSS